MYIYIYNSSSRNNNIDRLASSCHIHVRTSKRAKRQPTNSRPMFEITTMRCDQTAATKLPVRQHRSWNPTSQSRRHEAELI